MNFPDNSAENFLISDSLKDVIDESVLIGEGNRGSLELKFHSMSKIKSRMSFFADKNFCKNILSNGWNNKENVSIDLFGQNFLLNTDFFEIEALPQDDNFFLVSLRIEEVKTR